VVRCVVAETLEVWWRVVRGVVNSILVALIRCLDMHRSLHTGLPGNRITENSLVREPREVGSGLACFARFAWFAIFSQGFRNR
jgi:hypothetical protein